MDDAVHVPGYRLEQQLGRGAYGVVFAAREEATGQAVAVKLLAVRDPHSRTQAVREAALLGTIDHPHLAPVYGAVETGDGIALIMELATGGSLASLLHMRDVLPPGEVVTIFAPIAQGLADAHRRGVVHGDLRPANVLFTGDGRPMLSDLGVSRLLGEGRPAPEAGLAAPEVSAGHPASASSDIYGLAAVSVLALTGQPPGRRPMLTGLPPATYAALSAALQPDPLRRPDAESFANAMFALADPEPVVFDLDDSGDTSAHGPDARAAQLAEAEPVGGAPVRSEPVGSEPGAAESGGRRSRRGAKRSNSRGDESPAVAGEERPDASGDDDAPARVSTPARRPRRPRRRDVVTILAVILTIPIVGFGGYVVWNQLRGGDPMELPQAVRATMTTNATSNSELCGGPQPVPTEQPPEVSDWTNVVEHLYSLRGTAYLELDSELLCQVYSPTHPRLARDYDVLKAYADEGVRVQGLRFEVVTAELVSHESGIVVLEVTDRISPYQLVDADGEVVIGRDGEPEATWEMELVPSADASGWRIG